MMTSHSDFLYRAICLAEGVPPELARIGEYEQLYATEDGEPVCSSCGLLHNLAAGRPVC